MVIILVTADPDGPVTERQAGHGPALRIDPDRAYPIRDPGRTCRNHDSGRPALDHRSRASHRTSALDSFRRPLGLVSFDSALLAVSGNVSIPLLALTTS
jgi:hypothetical protein